jgi:phosphopantothenoylcysteine decarboxylase/phosphopantothenate--cysteine ligase
MPNKTPECEPGPLNGREVLVGVTGGIAAYKAATLVSRLVQAGAGVSVIMTEHATEFVGALTFQTLTGRSVATDLFASPEVYRAEHIALAEKADLVVVAPATANCLAKLATGMADDLLSTVLLAVDVPVVLAPAMNSRMWAHPAVRGNVETLGGRGVKFVGPQEGYLACGTVGPGRMAEPEEILAVVTKMLTGLPPRK